MKKKAITLGELEEFRDVQPVRKTFADIIDEAAANSPDREAVISGDTRLTFAEVHKRANKVAKGLIKLGIQKGDHVAILMQNIAEYPSIVFAISKVGAVIVTCNTRFMKDELQYILNKSEANTLIMTSEFPEAKISYIEMLNELAPGLSSSQPGELNLSKLPAIRRIVVFGNDSYKGCYTLADVEEMGQDVTDETLNNRQSQVKPDDTALIIFTSGTTGFPKGCVLRHGPMITQPAINGRIWKISEKDVMLLPLGLFTLFGLSAGIMFCFIFCATLVLEKVFDPGLTLELIQKERVTIVAFVPTMVTALFEHPNFASTDLSSLRTGNIGGTLCPPEMMRRARSTKRGWGLNCPGMTTVYGLTESHGSLASGTLDEPEDKALYTVGRFFPLVEVRIVDPPTGEEKGPGEEGEVIVKGDCVLTEYFREPEQTAEKIRDGWLHTGDLATRDEDGYCRITGRITEMIIIGGFNLYPKEVENKIREHPKVMDVSVFRVPDEKYGEVPAANIMLKPNVSMDEAEIREFCRNNMAKYKVPKYFQFVKEFPLSASGKVQKFKQSAEMIEELGLGEAKKAS